MSVILLALLIFVGLSAATWAVSMACYKSTFSDGPDPSADPNDSTVAACAVAAVTLSCFIPFVPGYLAELVIWAVAVYQFLPSRQSGRYSSYGNSNPEMVPLSTYFLKHGAAAVANAMKSASLIE